MKLNLSLFLLGLNPKALRALSLAKNEDDTNIGFSFDTNINSKFANEESTSTVLDKAPLGNVGQQQGNLNLRGGRALEGCAAGESDVVVTIETDYKPQEISWFISKGGPPLAGSPAGALTNGRTVYTWPLCLSGGNYVFSLLDTSGNGFCEWTGVCFGYFQVSVNGVSQFKVSGYNFGASTAKTFTVPTVQPNSAPNAICQNVSVDADNTCQATVEPSAFNNGSTDIDGDALSFSVNQSGPYGLGTTDVTMTVSDGTESNTCAAQVTVSDATAPTATCNDYSIDVSSGLKSVTIANIKGEANDNCAVTSEQIMSDNINFGCADVGNARDFILKVQDAAGNEATCTSTVTATNAQPVVNAGNGYEVLVQGSIGITSGNGQLSGTVTDSDNSSHTYVWTTNCPGATITDSDTLNAKISIASGTDPTDCSVTLAVSDVCSTVTSTASVSVVLVTSAPTPAPTQSPTVSSAPTHPTLSIVTHTLEVFILGSAFDGMSVEELQNQFSFYQGLSKAAIVAVIQDAGFNIAEGAISVSSSVISSSVRNLVNKDSRFLQESSGIQQDVAFNAPASAADIASITLNINNAIAANSITGVTASVSVVTTEYEEPPWPCNGVTCSNAGKCEVTSPTTALCRCENTFVTSESGLECICPDGLDFHANVNRCLPPPTAAPTRLPSKSPTLAPSSVPSDGKLDEEDDEDTPTCVDDMSGAFKLFNVMEEVECAWLTMNKDKTKIRKNKYCGCDEVKSLCQSTCGVCTGCDDMEGTFTLDNMKKRETCDWLTKNKLKTEVRTRRYCALTHVRDMCKASCGACAVEDASGRV